MSSTTLETDWSTRLSSPTNKVGKIGVCALEHKARSKPCQAILNNLMLTGEFEVVMFGDKVILDEAVESWPFCDFFISFFSQGFPLQKAIDYVTLRRPFVTNDLQLQKALWDRRLVLKLLEASRVPTPYRLVISRDGGPLCDDELRAKLLEHGVVVRPEKEQTFTMLDYDTLQLEDGSTITKPFVEKPVDGEDHNVFVYYNEKSGGGGRRLFRKIGNKSSEFDPNLVVPRTDGSYIYEQFMDTDNFEDVKAYTVGTNYCHAETRKSPVVDGIVRRNTYGKELRFVTKLSDEEKQFASSICKTFEQTICGFDLLRVGDKSFVIDVNGFSFVKDNTNYYDMAAQILWDIFVKAKREKIRSYGFIEPPPDEQEQKWVLKGQVTVVRHADRTPKQKFKYSFKSPYFLSLLQGHRVEVIIRDKAHLYEVVAATEEAIKAEAEDLQKLHQLRSTLLKKIDLPGTKVQIKPGFKDKQPDAELEKVQLIIKWGGEPTHSSRYQSCDLGEQWRKDTMLLNPKVLDDVDIYSSSERRVIATAQMFASALLKVDIIPSDKLHIVGNILDDSNAAKVQMDEVKKHLKLMLRQGMSPPSQFTWPEKVPQPFIVLQRVVDLMKYHRQIMLWRFEHDDVESFQERWCCNEDALLFKERWEKLFAEFISVEKVDPSRISELYDTIKYDALHNRSFLEHVFEVPLDSSSIAPLPEADAAMPNVIPNEAEYNGKFKFAKAPMSLFDRREYARLRELYLLAKILFDYICPQEYGITNDQKLDIGLLTSMPLVTKIIKDIQLCRSSTEGKATFYFTKESHMYTLLGILFGSDLPVKMARNQLPELDYLAQVCFEIYECSTSTGVKHQVRITISPGCNSLSPLDVQLDSKHCISCVPKRSFTHYLDLDDIIKRLSSQFNRVCLPKKFLPVNIQEGHNPLTM